MACRQRSSENRLEKISSFSTKMTTDRGGHIALYHNGHYRRDSEFERNSCRHHVIMAVETVICRCNLAVSGN